MKFFIDTANLEQIKEMQELGIIDGVTTNPSLLAKEGADPIEQLKKICALVDGPVSGEVIGLTTNEMVTEARELAKIAPTQCVKGHEDKINDLTEFIKFSKAKYNIGVIHILPTNLEEFFKKKDLHILIFGHTHQPLIKGTTYNTLLINPGSPTRPKAPPQKKGFEKPFPRPSVITLNIDKNGILSSFLITLNINEKLKIK